MVEQNDFWQIHFPFFWSLWYKEITLKSVLCVHRWERRAGVVWRQNKNVCIKSEFLESEAHGEVEIVLGKHEWAIGNLIRVPIDFFYI